MKKMVLGSCVAALIAGVAVADTVTSVNVVGYYNLEVGGSSNQVTYTLVSVPMTKMPADRGSIAGNTSNTIQVTGAGWGDEQFAVSGLFPTHFVEITSGAFEGRDFYIDSNTENELTLVAADDDLGTGDNPAAGSTYKIVPVTTLSDVFGEPGGEIKLKPGSGPALADGIYFLQDGWQGPAYYRNSGAPVLPLNHWVLGSDIVDNMPIHRDDGIMVKTLVGSEGATLTVAGEVSGSMQSIVIDSGYTLQGGMVAVDTLIKDAGLLAPEGPLQGGTGPALADGIYYYDNGWQGPVYYRNGGAPVLPINHWVDGSDNVDDTFILEAGKAYMFKVAAPGGWDRDTPVAQ
jgi:hypothetical protein